jgi:eukaryotic-like serine/threonine-protein kinase
MAVNIGILVSNYSIKKVLGSDEMGTVYLVANPSVARYDTLKVLTTELSGDADFRARFLQVAELATALSHPNIATVYSTGETVDHELWIAMQYVSGSDAYEELREHRMTAPRAVHIIAEVAKALDYAHGCNVVHGDVKPANFLLDPAGDRVLLGDFGIARDDDHDGTAAVGGRADIYALASSLYVLLAGATPIVSAGRPATNNAVNAVITKAMSENPDDRYPSAGEFAAAATEAFSSAA